MLFDVFGLTCELNDFLRNHLGLRFWSGKHRISSCKLPLLYDPDVYFGLLLVRQW